MGVGAPSRPCSRPEPARRPTPSGSGTDTPALCTVGNTVGDRVTLNARRCSILSHSACGREYEERQLRAHADMLHVCTQHCPTHRMQNFKIFCDRCSAPFPWCGSRQRGRHRQAIQPLSRRGRWNSSRTVAAALIEAPCRQAGTRTWAPLHEQQAAEVHKRCGFRIPEFISNQYSNTADELSVACCTAVKATAAGDTCPAHHQKR